MKNKNKERKLKKRTVRFPHLVKFSRLFNTIPFQIRKIYFYIVGIPTYVYNKHLFTQFLYMGINNSKTSHFNYNNLN